MFKQLEILVCSLKESGVWEIRWVNECRYEKGSQNIDQPKNIEEKSLGRASLLIFTK